VGGNEIYGMENVNTFGNHLSSSINPKYPDTSLSLGFAELGSAIHNFNRYFGLTIRPVCVE
jgi:hypothetical protein